MGIELGSMGIVSTTGEDVVKPAYFNYSRKITIDDFVKYVQGTLTEITAEMLQGVTEIRVSAFRDMSSLTSIVIPEGVKRINGVAFFNCINVKKLSVPDSLDYFDRSAIDGSPDIGGISHDAYYVDEYGNEYLGNEQNHYVVLLNSSDLSQSINTSVKVLTNTCCTVLGGEIISLPESLQGIMDYGVYCANESISIGKNVTYINRDAFAACQNLKEIVVDVANNVYASDGGIVYNKQKTSIVVVPHQLEEVVISDTVTSIANNQFANYTSLVSLVIGTGVTSMGSSVCYRCTNLTSVVYRGNVLISTNIFYNCNKIIKYDFRNATSIPTLRNRTYLGHAANCKIIVPDELYDSWQLATNWSALTDVVWVKASEYTEE